MISVRVTQSNVPVLCLGVVRRMRGRETEGIFFIDYRVCSRAMFCWISLRNDYGDGWLFKNTTIMIR